MKSLLVFLEISNSTCTPLIFKLIILKVPLIELPHESSNTDLQITCFDQPLPSHPALIPQIIRNHGAPRRQSTLAPLGRIQSDIKQTESQKKKKKRAALYLTSLSCSKPLGRAHRARLHAPSQSRPESTALPSRTQQRDKNHENSRYVYTAPRTLG